MKKNLIPLLILILVVFSSCCDCDENKVRNENQPEGNALLPTEVMLSHNLGVDRNTGGQDWNGGLNLKGFIDEIFEKSLKGEIQTFDPDYIPYKFVVNEIEQIEYRSGRTRDTVIAIDPETGEEVIKVLEGEIEKEEMKMLHFTERWDFDKTKFQLKKEVVEIDIVRELITELSKDEYKIDLMKVCALHFDNPIINIQSRDMNKRELLAENIKYEFDLGAYKTWVDDLDQEVFLELIMEKVRDNKVEIYDFNDNTRKYSYEEIVAQNDFLTDTIKMLDESTMEIVQRVIQYEFDKDMIGSYIFIEDWYYDPDTYKIEKVVKGIAPVLHYYHESDIDMTDMQKKILFQINFNY